MHPKLSKIALLLLLLFLLISPGSAQSGYELCFRGKMANIQGETVSLEHFDLKVQISKRFASDILYEFRTASYSDESGWFGFIIPNISAYLQPGDTVFQTLDITLEILPNNETKWMREGDDFLVTYTLKPYADDAGMMLMMTRMEGSQLQTHSEEHLFAFKDQEPFAYLMGGFLLTDAPPCSEQSLLDLQQWLTPDPSDEEGASRGVKGGFPSGGYYKKK